MIPEGKRAITVKVDEVIAVAGFALPGSYVDILVSGKDADKQQFSRTVLSRVKVLAVAQETASEPDKPKVVKAVTLELTTREAEELDLARNIGVLSLVLRNELDTGKINSAGVRLPDIVTSQSTRITTPAEKPAPSLQSRGPEEIRGISR
jgi:pilus assembly protein CpaB